MQALFCTAPTLTISVIYCLWQHHAQRERRRDSILRQRVAYMLWVMANQVR